MKYCPVAKKCGGCRYIHTEYSESLVIKQKTVEDLFEGYSVNPIIGMKDPYHYRHKVYATFSHGKDGKILAGLFEENTHRLVDPACQRQFHSAGHVCSGNGTAH